MSSFEKWTLVTAGLAAFATLLAVVVAIWGESIRQRWTRPRLELSLLEAEGQLNTRADGKEARYYSLLVHNRRQSSPATNVRVLLLGIDQEGPTGNWEPVTFGGPVQVSWRWPQFTPTYPTIGPDEIATFGFLVKGESEFHYQLLWCPNNLVPSLGPDTLTRLRFRAVSDSAQSALLAVEALWDGVWADDSEAMATHLCVTQTHVERHAGPVESASDEGGGVAEPS